MKIKVRARLAAWVLAVASAAGCGGGAGEGGAEEATSSPTGLAPARTAPGAVLFDDASALRPFRQGAVWRYRGEQVPQTGAFPVRYETLTTHASAHASGVEEHTSNAANAAEPELVQVVHAGGDIFSDASLDFSGKGEPGRVRFVELRSPVRAGDLYTIVDRRLTDTNIDVDGDRQPDTLDLAIHVRVLGLETVALPNLPPMESVRTQMLIQSRVIPSSTRVPGPIVAGRVDTWYAPGVGVVRRTSRMPAVGLGEETIEEQLVSWNGITSGVGAMSPQALTIPASSPVFPGHGLPPLTWPLAFGFDTHALVVTHQPRDTSGPYWLSGLVSKVDLSGRVVHSKPIPGYMNDVRQRVWPYRHGLVMQTPVPNEPMQIALTRFDTEGTAIGSVTHNLTGAHDVNLGLAVEGAVDEDGTVWLLFTRDFRDMPKSFEKELVLRAYGPDGAERFPEMLVQTGLPWGSNPGHAIAVARGRAVMSWRGGPAGSDVFIGSAGLNEAPQVKLLAAGSPGSASAVTPLRLGATSALIWQAPPGGLSLGASGGVLIDEAFEMKRAGSDWLAEQLPGVPSFSMTPPANRGPRIAISTTTVGRLWPDDSWDSRIDVVAWVDAGTRALALEPGRSVRFPATEMGGHAVFADRVLVFGQQYGKLTSTIVWTPPARP
ncbi:MAG: hypothetical protein KIT17_00795 [Rubrivivax sp.]|nr:hypothetical protein [Rubrivivax sp.]